MKSRGKKITLLAGTVVLVVVGFTAYHYRANIRFWWLFEPIGPNAQGYPEYRHRQTGIIFVKLPGGTFWMGAQRDDPEGRNYDPEAQNSEGPVHEATLSPFMIAKCEVTQAQWMAVMGSIPSYFQRGGRGAALIPAGVATDDWPVEAISWRDCQGFCRRSGFRLPTEAEWEYACRTGTEGPFSGTRKLDEMGWYTANSGGRTHAIGEKQPNGFGLHDMHGNVWEWCEDVFDGDFYSKPEASRIEPLCTAGSRIRVIRGGSWFSYVQDCRSAHRNIGQPWGGSGFVGFRPVFAPLPD